VTDGSGTESRDEARQVREAGVARAVSRRRRDDVDRAVSAAVERATKEARPHDCAIEVRAPGVLRSLLPGRRLPGWSLGTVHTAATGPGSSEAFANLALGSDGRLYWNAASPEARGVGADGRFATPGVFGPRRLSDDLEFLDGVMRLLDGGEQPPSEPA
jgi:hypothetical protein